MAKNRVSFEFFSDVTTFWISHSTLMSFDVFNFSRLNLLLLLKFIVLMTGLKQGRVYDSAATSSDDLAELLTVFAWLEIFTISWLCASVTDSVADSRSNCNRIIEGSFGIARELGSKFKQMLLGNWKALRSNFINIKVFPNWQQILFDTWNDRASCKF